VINNLKFSKTSFSSS